MTMRVLHTFVQPRGGGGSLAATLALVEALRRDGNPVAVFTRRSSDLGDALAGRLRAGLSALYAPGVVREFEALLGEFQPHLVHCNELFPLISPDILRVCGRRGIPVVMTCDDYHLTCPARTHLRGNRICTDCLGGREYRAIIHRCKGGFVESAVNALYSARLRRSDLLAGQVAHFITCSGFARRWLVEHAGLPADRVSVIPHAIEIPDAPADAAAGRYAGFAGRFVPEKGIATLLQAAALCQVPVKLARSAHQHGSLPVPDGADVVVTRTREELNLFYRQARMLVVPSLWFETQGLVGAEAMSHGIPVIASRLGALQDLVCDGVDGLLFEAGNARDLAEKIGLLWRDPALAVRLGRAARDKAVRLWNTASNLAATKEVYRQARSGVAG